MVTSKDMALYYFNDYIYFTGTIKVSNGGTYSILITFGYANGKDSVLDISPYLKDSNNTNINLNLFDYFLNSIVIDNNIFNYSIVQQVKLLRIPEELNFYLGDSKLENGAIISSKDSIVLQNANLLKNFSRYSIYYQLYEREPIYKY